MARELLILRHGKSDWDAGTDDFNRPLKDRGKRAAQRMGVWIHRQQLLPDHVVSSPATRALETARKLCKAMGIGDQGIQRDSRIYEASAEELLEVLADCPQGARRVLLVGHNPGLEDLLLMLAAEPLEIMAGCKLLPTATLARLTLPDDWQRLSPGCALLESITRPGMLPRKFPFPGPDGVEQRDRPAYYYTQSAVIPYRLRAGKPEILVISSSRNKHLVLPKGIQDPGLTAQESAVKEALEEAGIEGEVAAEALGEYQYEKWGATCTVTVFPMLVTREIPEDEWKEPHRARKWMSADKAAERLKQKALQQLVRKLEAML